MSVHAGICSGIGKSLGRRDVHYMYILIRTMNSDPVHPLPGQNISWSKTKHDRSLLFIVSQVAVIPVLGEMIFYLLKE